MEVVSLCRNTTFKKLLRPMIFSVESALFKKKIIQVYCTTVNSIFGKRVTTLFEEIGVEEEEEEEVLERFLYHGTLRDNGSHD